MAQKPKNDVPFSGDIERFHQCQRGVVGGGGGGRGGE
jgi:hypothetical protein